MRPYSAVLKNEKLKSQAFVLIGERLDFNSIFLKQQFKASLEQYFIFYHAAEGYPASRVSFDLPWKISFLFPIFLGRSKEIASMVCTKGQHASEQIIKTNWVWRIKTFDG